jgi:hypothetical protein
VNVVPVSMGTRPVTVVGSDAELVLETRLSEGEWVSILRNQFDTEAVSGTPADCDDVSAPAAPDETDGRYLVDCVYAAPAPGSEFGELTLSFEDGSYDLRLAKVGLTPNDNDDPTADFAPEEARYLTTVQGDDSTITDEQTQRLTVEVRDRFNNPVSGIVVSFSTGDGEFRTTASDGSTSTTTTGTTTATTDVDGRASVVFVPGTTGDLDVLAASDLNDDGVTNDNNGLDDDPEEVTLDVSVADADGASGGGDDGLETINRGDRGIYYSRADVGGSGKSGSPEWEVDFRSHDGNQYTITQVRVSFASSEDEAIDRVDNLYWTSSGGTVPADEDIIAENDVMDIANDFDDIDPHVVVGGTDAETLVFEFNAKFKGGSSRQEFIVVSMIVEDSVGQETFQTFFIGQTV